MPSLPILGTQFKSEDEIDKQIIDNTIKMVIELQVTNLILTDKEKSDSYLGHIMDLTDRLLKANSQRRAYLSQEKMVLNKLKAECEKSNNNADLSFNEVCLTSIIDSTLTQIKAALDSLAKSLNPLFGFRLHGWHKNGGVVVSALTRNLPSDMVEKSRDLKKYIETTTPNISYIILLRDAIHRSRLENISDIIYKQETKELIPQQINYGRKTENVHLFLTRLMDNMIIFFTNVICFSLRAKVPGGMIIVKKENNPQQMYFWAIPPKE